MATELATTRTGSSFIRTLKRALEADAREQIELDVKIGILLAASRDRREIAETLGVTGKRVYVAIDRLRRVAPEFDRYSGGA